MHLLTVSLNRLSRATVPMDCLAFVSKINIVQYTILGGGVVYDFVCALTEMACATYHTQLKITRTNLHTYSLAPAISTCPKQR